MATSIGEKIKIRRMELGWSQEELANRMGYAYKSTVSRVESGRRDVSQSKAKKFAEVLGTSVAYLMDWDIDSTLAAVTVRARNDSEFMMLINNINNLNEEQLNILKQLVGQMSKNN